MPVLPICDEDGRLLPNATFLMWGAMLFPATGERKNSEAHLKSRQDLLMAYRGISLYTQARDQGLDSVPLTLEALKLFLDAPSVAETLEGEDEASRDGLIAGRTLRLLEAVHEDRPKRATITQALRYIAKFLEHRKSLNTGKRLPSSIQHLRAIWGDYKSVAHLWAAADVCPWIQQEKVILGGRLFSFIPDETRLREFLAIAEYFRAFGESHVPPRQTHKAGPVLEEDEAWRPPESLHLPPCPSFENHPPEDF